MSKDKLNRLEQLFIYGYKFDALYDHVNPITGEVDTNDGQEALSASHRRLLDMGFPIEHINLLGEAALRRISKVKKEVAGWTPETFMVETRAYKDLKQTFEWHLQSGADTVFPNSVVLDHELEEVAENYGELGIDYKMLKILSVKAHIDAQREDADAMGVDHAK